ncbi:hypothetical protein HPB51_017681 [Rhipicephalus microplus]|uniref:HAT C-terminal dimerisation domain-containing protein n=1 Tax=Rhipicephalus microplus TaxID=6941 RepID=A0A9J6E1Y4_RHIMP|nr:hypothetical protein HPB51_017681 [Rhipicephalus microplus]
MKRTEKNRLLRRIKLRPPQHWRKAKRVRTFVATRENAPVYMNRLRTNTSRTPMRRREMMVAAVQLQVIFVLQSTLGKVTPLPLRNAKGRSVADLFSLTLPLCKFLQKIDCGFAQACDHVKNVIDVLSTKRASAETEFNKIFLKSLSLLKITNVEMALPRITGRQMQRSNVPSATPEEYYRRNVYLPLLADFENQLRDRFDAHKKVVVGLNMLLPKFCASASLSDIDDAVQFYLGDIPSANVIEAEFTLWGNKCCQIEEKNRLACALEALEMCNRDFFPNIHSLLSILATLPVSTSTPKRSFSTLRRLKSYLRNHMNNDRLTGLALLSIHRELQVTPEQVLTKFCKLPRRKNFLV